MTVTLLEDTVIEVDSGERYRHGRPLTRCRLRLFQPATAPVPVAVVSELADNPGMSITNSAEYIWRVLARRLDSLDFVMVEHYGAESYVGGRESETFDIVSVVDGEPDWTPSTAEAFVVPMGDLTLTFDRAHTRDRAAFGARPLRPRHGEAPRRSGQLELAVEVTAPVESALADAR